jgi:hypothetical protein
LKNEGFLASYSVDKARTREGFVLTLRPGAAFFQDYDRFYRHRAQGELQWDYHAERRGISEPLKVAYLFIEKRTGHPAASIDFVPSKDVETAKQLLAAIGFEEIPAFLDYALAEARKTNFDVQTLGGVKMYLAGYMTFTRRRATNQVREADRKKEEQLEARTLAYANFRRTQAADMFATLPQGEQDIIETLARTSAAKFNGSLQDSMFKFGLVRFTLERHGGKLQTFEQWTAGQLAA